MVQVNLNNPMEIQAVGLKALEEYLGIIGAAKFIALNNLGYGDYTKEKQDRTEPSLDEIDGLLKNISNQ
ncbi:MAG: hypothetical protein LUC97_06490 [Clostridiales bacterium]|nr:hypothetical protein [Clostridiales bacterium]